MSLFLHITLITFVIFFFRQIQLMIIFCNSWVLKKIGLFVMIFRINELIFKHIFFLNFNFQWIKAKLYNFFSRLFLYFAILWLICCIRQSPIFENDDTSDQPKHIREVGKWNEWIYKHLAETWSIYWSFFNQNPE